MLRWAAFEAAQTAARPASPDHAYYLDRKARLCANRAALTIARTDHQAASSPKERLGVFPAGAADGFLTEPKVANR